MTSGRPRFAEAREALWQALVHAAGLDAGRLEGWSGDRVDVEAAGWSLTLDSFRVPVEKHEHTRMVVALPHVDLRFRVAEPDAFSWIGTLFGLLDIDGAELWHYFPEMMRTAPGCRFYNCSHLHEPGCGVTSMVKTAPSPHEICARRYKIYSDLFAELSRPQRY